MYQTALPHCPPRRSGVTVSYEAASSLALTIHQEDVWCQVVAMSGHSFAVEIALPQYAELYVASVEQWRRLRSRVS
jgi:hypothetical protein